MVTVPPSSGGYEAVVERFDERAIGRGAAVLGWCEIDIVSRRSGAPRTRKRGGRLNGPEPRVRCRYLAALRVARMSVRPAVTRQSDPVTPCSTTPSGVARNLAPSMAIAPLRSGMATNADPYQFFEPPRTAGWELHCFRSIRLQAEII
jgi:hypothetical protein